MNTVSNSSSRSSENNCKNTDQMLLQSLEMRRDALKNKMKIWSVVGLGVATHYNTSAAVNMRTGCKHTCDTQHWNCQKVPQREQVAGSGAHPEQTKNSNAFWIGPQNVLCFSPLCRRVQAVGHRTSKPHRRLTLSDCAWRFLPWQHKQQRMSHLEIPRKPST